MDEDSNDVDVPSPGSQVERGAAFAVSHVSWSLKLEQFQHHVPKDKTDGKILMNRALDKNYTKQDNKSNIINDY